MLRKEPRCCLALCLPSLPLSMLITSASCMDVSSSYHCHFCCPTPLCARPWHPYRLLIACANHRYVVTARNRVATYLRAVAAAPQPPWARTRAVALCRRRGPDRASLPCGPCGPHTLACRLLGRRWQRRCRLLPSLHLLPRAARPLRLRLSMLWPSTPTARALAAPRADTTTDEAPSGQIGRRPAPPCGCSVLNQEKDLAHK